ncbi:hypothetical protein NC652_032500 [Populus alba x Populus x berolinensis]|nr:hypothetical protein NC652_032500 [Populus alba x Populus x berolinensis]
MAFCLVFFKGLARPLLLKVDYIVTSYLRLAFFFFMIASTSVLTSVYYSLTYKDPPGFSCPRVPIVPSACIFFSIFLFAQLHDEAWVRFVVLSIIMIGIYAFYHAKPGSDEPIFHQRAPTKATR